MKLFDIIFCLCLVPAAALAQEARPRTCRILFLEPAPNAPETLQLFDGRVSREVELPRMNFSCVYELPAGALKLYLLPTAPADPRKIPPAAPVVTVPEALLDIYLLVSSDPSNAVAPVRMQVINAGEDKVKRGQMLWFNLTPSAVGGTLGTASLAIAPGARAVLDAPATRGEEYPVALSFRMPGDKQLYPLCETRWRHDPRGRSLVFIIPEVGRRSPRVMAFSDYREAPATKP
ncbi:hypothetical protein [uncultured Thiodictyon sp.]|uniref:hypothetical protein n=1 Tax=uncultured Thiodictyon sp. TaxID=1846217 RepID=UPI0025E85BBD|nr:hypothetical protein [uncultured Thiodictyon sp.]